jgi:hypothetical protein
MQKLQNDELVKAHRYFSAECFNRAWDFIDLPARTPEQERTMLQLGLASLWHWSQRPDCTPGNLSVGYWQVARIYALLGQAQNAYQYGELSLQAGQAEGSLPFHRAYAYEALARAASIAQDRSRMKEYLRLATETSQSMTDPEARKALLADLATIT